MSTYDAYNLSLRDSTEFIVPTGGSGNISNGRFSIFNVKIRGRALLLDNSYGASSERLFYVHAPIIMIAQDDSGVLSDTANVDTDCQVESHEIPCDNEYHDYSFLAVDNIAYFIYDPAEEYLIENLSGAVELHSISAGQFTATCARITGDCQFDYVASADPK